ncbi:MAG: caspase family protein [Verrucomicrobiota bacterium]
MKKHAILINSSDVKGESDLPGARVDINNWWNFLQSRLGGSWRSDQIHILNKPSLAELDCALNTSGDGYCFVAFSGHGTEGSISLNDLHEFCPISRLKPKGKRGTVVIDSCRGISPVKSVTFLGEARATDVINDARAGRYTEFSEIVKKSDHALTASSADALFDEELRLSSEGIVTMYSCAKGQSAGEDPKAGGYYTSALMDAANRFLDADRKRSVLSTKEAHDHAASIVPAPQAPVYTPSYLVFPFAVRSLGSQRFAF